MPNERIKILSTQNPTATIKRNAVNESSKRERMANFERKQTQNCIYDKPVLTIYPQFKTLWFYICMYQHVFSRTLLCMCICMYICTYMCIHSSRAGTRQKHKAFSFWSFVHLSSCSKRQSAKINLNNYIHTYMPGFSYSAYYTLLFCIN